MRIFFVKMGELWPRGTIETTIIIHSFKVLGVKQQYSPWLILQLFMKTHQNSIKQD